VHEGLVMMCDVDLGNADATRVHTVEVARGFAAEGLEVDLLARGPDPRIPGVRYVRAVGTDRQRIRRLASLNAQIIRLLLQRRATARRLYVRDRWTMMLSLVLGRLLGYRVVTQVDDVPLDFSPTVDYFKRALVTTMGRLAHGIVAVTPQIKELLVDTYKVPSQKVAVLPNGADVDFFRPGARSDAIQRLGLDANLRYIVFCGHFAPWMDFDTMLKAFALVAGRRPDARLVLVGDGNERSQIDRLLRELEIQDTVIITGYIHDRARVRDFITASVVALSAYRIEHRALISVSPVKLAEYLATGRAVVATDLPGLRETLVETGAGRVVPVNPVAMSEAILELLEPEHADRLGTNGRRVAEERFSWRLIVKQTLPVFGM
jgi:glycosyltransferase involved in cell wall biosynthesis